MAETRAAISLKSFLETTAPGGDVTTIPGLGGKTYQSGAVQFAGPDITLFCDFEQCNGFRLFKDISEPNLEAGVVKQAFVSYRCKNCSAKTKVSTHPNNLPIPYVRLNPIANGISAGIAASSPPSANTACAESLGHAPPPKTLAVRAGPKTCQPPPTPKTPKTRAPIADFFFENLA